MDVSIKRIYEQPSADDGFRVLVDRLWPRGVSKEKAALDLWDKDIAPSNELRLWFSHDPAKWEEFKKRYREELDSAPDAVNLFKKALSGQKKVTLLYGAKDPAHNQAVVLQEYLKAFQL